MARIKLFHMCGFLLAGMLALQGISGAYPVRAAEGDVSVSAQSFSLLPDVTEEKTRASYWAARALTDENKTLADAAAIAKANADFLTADGTQMHDLKAAPDTIDGVQRNTLIQTAAQADAAALNLKPGAAYFADGTTVSEAWVSGLTAACVNPAAQTVQQIRFAICTTRADLRVFPTSTLVSDSPSDPDFDLLQSSSVRVNEPMYIDSVSADGSYYHVVTSNCIGWIAKDSVAVCADRAEWLTAWDIPADQVLVVCTDRIYLEDSNANPELSGKMLTMGTVLREVPEAERPETVGNRSSYQNYVVYLPVRNTDGSYRREMALISQHKQVHEGYLRLTTANLLKTAATMLGNCYGWGGMLSSQDCSGYARDVYKCFGFELPRNSSWQQKIPMMKFDLSGYTDSQKKKLLAKLPAGTLLFFPGHEMLYLGQADGHEYVQSAVSSLVKTGDTAVLRTRSVLINTLDTRRRNGITWLSALTTAVVPFRTADEKLPTLYKTTIRQAAGGTISAAKMKAAAGTTVKLSSVVKKGYRLRYYIVNGKIIYKASFVMPAGKAVVTAAFAKTK